MNLPIQDERSYKPILQAVFDLKEVKLQIYKNILKYYYFCDIFNVAILKGR